MDVTPFIPIIVEATKFVFDEVGKWIDDVRQRSKKDISEPIKNKADMKAPKLTQKDFAYLEANPPELVAAINIHSAKTDVYEIRGLVNQIQTHRRNLIDLETTEAEYGPLTPQHIKRGIEREADAIIEKSTHLKSLLEQVYGRRIENA
jgi:hypothetical protein